MKAIPRVGPAALAAILLVTSPGFTAAQASAPAMQGDVSGTIGWLAVNARSNAPLGNDDWGNSVFAAGAAGWYWTDHLKTEVEVGAGTEARTYDGIQVTVNGRSGFRSIDSRFSRRWLALSQHYQFFRNAWFHPYLGAGLDVTWERRRDDLGPATAWDDASRRQVLLELPRVDGPRTETRVRPIVAGGFKAYLTRRAFFRADMRVTFGDQVDSTLLRAGFGVDF